MRISNSKGFAIMWSRFSFLETNSFSSMFCEMKISKSKTESFKFWYFEQRYFAEKALIIDLRHIVT
jgi:hypothetical protein